MADHPNPLPNPNPNPNPLQPVRDNDGFIRFHGERERASKHWVQNRLTRLGRNVTEWFRLSESQKNIKTPELKKERMKKLLAAKVLRTRNGFDLDGIAYLVNVHGFRGWIEVRDVHMRSYLMTLVDRQKLKYLRVRVREEAVSSDDPDAKDEENDSMGRNDSDNGVSDLRKQGKRAKKKKRISYAAEESGSEKEGIDYPDSD